MRILIISDIYPYSSQPEQTDAVMLLHNYARSWNETNYVEVIHPHSYNLISVWNRKVLKREFKLNGIVIHNRHILRLPGGRLWKRGFLNAVDISTFDVILGCMPVSLELTNDLSNRYKIPYITYLQGTDYRRSGAIGGVLSSNYQKWLSEASKVVCVSELLSKRFFKAVPNHISIAVVPGAVLDHWVEEVPYRKFDFSSKLKILTIARLVKQKRHHVILEMLLKSKLDCEYVIVGDGEDSDEIKKKVTSSDYLNQIVSFKGKKSLDEIKEIMDLSDIMILLSTNESFGLVFLEAMARGCIVIGTRNDGIDGTILHGFNGFLCESDPLSLEKLMNKILAMPEYELQKVSENAKSTAQKHTYSHLANKFMGLFKQALDS